MNLSMSDFFSEEQVSLDALESLASSLYWGHHRDSDGDLVVKLNSTNVVIQLKPSFRLIRLSAYWGCGQLDSKTKVSLLNELNSYHLARFLFFKEVVIADYYISYASLLYKRHFVVSVTDFTRLAYDALSRVHQKTPFLE